MAETGRRGDGETGRRGDGETGRRGDGETGRRGDGIIGERGMTWKTRDTGLDWTVGEDWKDRSGGRY